MNSPAEQPPSFSVRRKRATIGTRGTLVTDDPKFTWLPASSPSKPQILELGRLVRVG
jgi:hypothetical protein